MRKKGSKIQTREAWLGTRRGLWKLAEVHDWNEALWHGTKVDADYKAHEGNREQVDTFRNQGRRLDRWNKRKGMWPETRGELLFKIKQEVTKQKTWNDTTLTAVTFCSPQWALCSSWCWEPSCCWHTTLLGAGPPPCMQTHRCCWWAKVSLSERAVIIRLVCVQQLWSGWISLEK